MPCSNPALHTKDCQTAQHDAETDGWLMAQILRSVPDLATIHVCYQELADRHSPFFTFEFETAFKRACSGRVE